MIKYLVALNMFLKIYEFNILGFEHERYKKVGVSHDHSVVIINMVRRERIVYLLVLYAVT